MKSFKQLREELNNRGESLSEDTEYAFGYRKPSQSAATKGMAHAHKSGMKINHGDQGNTPGSKLHKKPDITVDYEIGDEPHRDHPSGVTLHSKAAKAHASAKHFAKADHHAHQEEDEEDFD